MKKKIKISELIRSSIKKDLDGEHRSSDELIKISAPFLRDMWDKIKGFGEEVSHGISAQFSAIDEIDKITDEIDEFLSSANFENEEDGNQYDNPFGNFYKGSNEEYVIEIPTKNNQKLRITIRDPLDPILIEKLFSFRDGRTEWNPIATISIYDLPKTYEKFIHPEESRLSALDRGISLNTEQDPTIERGISLADPKNDLEASVKSKFSKVSFVPQEVSKTREKALQHFYGNPNPTPERFKEELAPREANEYVINPWKTGGGEATLDVGNRKQIELDANTWMDEAFLPPEHGKRLTYESRRPGQWGYDVFSPENFTLTGEEDLDTRKEREEIFHQFDPNNEEMQRMKENNEKIETEREGKEQRSLETETIERQKNKLIKELIAKYPEKFKKIILELKRIDSSEISLDEWKRLFRKIKKQMGK